MEVSETISADRGASEESLPDKLDDRDGRKECLHAFLERELAVVQPASAIRERKKLLASTASSFKPVHLVSHRSLCMGAWMTAIAVTLVYLGAFCSSSVWLYIRPENFSSGEYAKDKDRTLKVLETSYFPIDAEWIGPNFFHTEGRKVELSKWVGKVCGENGADGLNEDIKRLTDESLAFAKIAESHGCKDYNRVACHQFVTGGSRECRWNKTVQELCAWSCRALEECPKSESGLSSVQVAEQWCRYRQAIQSRLHTIQKALSRGIIAFVIVEVLFLWQHMHKVPTRICLALQIFLSVCFLGILLQLSLGSLAPSDSQKTFVAMLREQCKDPMIAALHIVQRHIMEKSEQMASGLKMLWGAWIALTFAALNKYLRLLELGIDGKGTDVNQMLDDIPIRVGNVLLYPWYLLWVWVQRPWWCIFNTAWQQDGSEFRDRYKDFVSRTKTTQPATRDPTITNLLTPVRGLRLAVARFVRTFLSSWNHLYRTWEWDALLYEESIASEDEQRHMEELGILDVNTQNYLVIRRSFMVVAVVFGSLYVVSFCTCVKERVAEARTTGSYLEMSSDFRQFEVNRELELRAKGTFCSEQQCESGPSGANQIFLDYLMAMATKGVYMMQRGLKELAIYEQIILYLGEVTALFSLIIAGSTWCHHATSRSWILFSWFSLIFTPYLCSAIPASLSITLDGVDDLVTTVIHETIAFAKLEDTVQDCSSTIESVFDSFTSYKSMLHKVCFNYVSRFPYDVLKKHNLQAVKTGCKYFERVHSRVQFEKVKLKLEQVCMALQESFMKDLKLADDATGSCPVDSNRKCIFRKCPEGMRCRKKNMHCACKSDYCYAKVGKEHVCTPNPKRNKDKLVQILLKLANDAESLVTYAMIFSHCVNKYWILLPGLVMTMPTILLVAWKFRLIMPLARLPAYCLLLLPLLFLPLAVITLHNFLPMQIVPDGLVVVFVLSAVLDNLRWPVHVWCDRFLEPMSRARLNRSLRKMGLSMYLFMGLRYGSLMWIVVRYYHKDWLLIRMGIDAAKDYFYTTHWASVSFLVLRESFKFLFTSSLTKVAAYDAIMGDVNADHEHMMVLRQMERWREEGRLADEEQLMYVEKVLAVKEEETATLDCLVKFEGTRIGTIKVSTEDNIIQSDGRHQHSVFF